MAHDPETQLLLQALTLGYSPAPCAGCSPPSGRCANCGGTGRIWVDGPASLDDAGLRRLIDRHAAMAARDPRGIFVPSSRPSAADDAAGTSTCG